MLADIHKMWLPEGELCAVDIFVAETKKEENRHLLNKPAFISPLCMVEMKKDPYLNCKDDFFLEWHADELTLNGKHYPPMIYYLHHYPDNWAQLLYVKYDGELYYFANDYHEDFELHKCVVICKENEDLSHFISTI